MNIITRLAVKWLTRQLRKDEGFYNAYKSNIAMAFYDECRWAGLVNTKRDGDEKKSIHEIANRAATRFMDMWIEKNKYKEEQKEDLNKEEVKKQ